MVVEDWGRDGDGNGMVTLLDRNKKERKDCKILFRLELGLNSPFKYSSFDM